MDSENFAEQPLLINQDVPRETHSSSDIAEERFNPLRLTCITYRVCLNFVFETLYPAFLIFQIIGNRH